MDNARIGLLVADSGKRVGATKQTGQSSDRGWWFVQENISKAPSWWLTPVVELVLLLVQ